MITEEEMEDMFTYNDTKRCLALTYEIYHDNETVIDTSDELYSVLKLSERTNGSLVLDTNSAAQDGTVIQLEYKFKIKAVNAGGAFGWKDVQFNIIICGYEVLDNKFEEL